MVNEKDPPFIRQLRAHHHFHQPCRSRQFFRMFPELPGFLFLQGHGLRTANLEQRIAGDRIQRLDTAVQQDRQFAELTCVKAGFRLRSQRDQDLDGEDCQQNPGQILFHKVLRFEPAGKLATSPAPTGPTGTAASFTLRSFADFRIGPFACT